MLGVQEYANRDRYAGQWEADKKNGKGVHTYNNGDKYDGNWLNNERSGEGIFVAIL